MIELCMSLVNVMNQLKQCLIVLLVRNDCDGFFAEDSIGAQAHNTEQYFQAVHMSEFALAFAVSPVELLGRRYLVIDEYAVLEALEHVDELTFLRPTLLVERLSHL